MALVKFYRGARRYYNKDVHADGIYFSTDTLEIILNEVTYGGNKDTIDSITTKLETIAEGALVNVIEKVSVDGTALTITDKGVNIELNKLLDAYKPKAENVIVDSEKVTATTIAEAIDEIATSVTNASTASVVTVTSADGEDKTLKVYTISQNGKAVGTINIPVDMVVSSGKIIEKEGKKYISLTIANQTDPLDIPVDELVDVYTGGNGIAISDTNEISIEIAPTAKYIEVGATGLTDKGIDTAISTAITPVSTKVTALETSVGTAEDTASNTGSVYARLALLKAEIAALTGGEGSGTISDMIDEAVDQVKAYTVNSKAISTNPVLAGSDIAVGTITYDSGELLATDTINVAVSKISNSLTWHEAI